MKLRTAFLLLAISLFAFGAQAQMLPTYNTAGVQIGLTPLPHNIGQASSVNAVTVNGQPTDPNRSLNIVGGQYDPATNSVMLALERATGSKGASEQGNTSIVGSLYVSQNTYLGTAGNQTYVVRCYARIVVNDTNSGGASTWTVPANTGTATITDDGQAGTGVAVTLPTEVNGQFIYFHNSDDSATTGDVVIASNADAVVFGSNGAWHQK